MLVLSRRPRENILIGESIRITVVQVVGNRVKLGIEAPPEVPVHREEVQRRIATMVEADEPVTAESL
ncbi:MAG: carbon storage regulator [Pirellulaceae bacterium]|nr:MAG: carbon storage regulator [Pirellulaceae bacterium]